MRTIKTFTLLSMLKFGLLLVLSLGILYALKHAKLFNGMTLDEALQYLSENPEEGIPERVDLVSRIYRFSSLFIPCFFGFGFIFNIIVRVTLNKTKSGGLAVLFGFIKIVTLSPICAIALFASASALSHEREDRENYAYSPSQSNPSIQRERNEREPFVPKKEYYVSNGISFLSMIIIIGFIGVLCFMGIGAYSLLKEGRMPSSQVILGFLGIAFFGLLFTCLFVLGIRSAKKKKRFLKYVSFTKIGMSIEEVRYIMKEYTPINSGYDRHDDYVLVYKFQQGGTKSDYEQIAFVFTGNRLVEKKESHRRTTTYIRHY